MSKLTTILFFTFCILLFSTAVYAEPNCFPYPTVSRAPTETKMFGDVIYRHYAPPYERFVVGYENFIFKKKTAKSCHNLEFNLWFSNEGEKFEKPESVQLYFYSTSTYLKYTNLAKRKFKVLDGQKVIFSRNLTLTKTHRKDLKNYSEELATDISVATLAKIAKTDELSFYLGGIKLDMTGKDKNAIIQIVDFIEKME